MTPQPFIIPAHVPATSNVLWCCYSHSVGDTAIYVGVCRFQEVLQAPDAHRNSAWVKEYAAQSITINVLHICASFSEAFSFRNRITRTTFVYCNKHGRDTRYFTAIRCVETGQEWKNAAAVCKELRLNKGNLSNHLNKKPGFKSIQGKTYVRFTKSAT